MLPNFPLRSAGVARRLGERATVPIVLLLLLAMVGGLAVRMQAAERSHRVTANRVLRDYAGFAAWQVARRHEEYLGCLARSSTFRAYTRVLRRNEPLPAAAILDSDTTGRSCGFAHDTRLAFRISGPSGVVSISRRDTAAERLITRIAPTLLANFSRRAQSMQSQGAHAALQAGAEARLRFDTVGGTRVGITFAAVRDSAGDVRAVFGVVGSLGSRLVNDLDDILDRGPLLPPTLTGDVPSDSVVRVQVTFNDGTPVYSRGVRRVSQYAATDTMPASLGGLIVHAALASALISSLPGGQFPGSRLPLVLALLALGGMLTGIALLQLKQSRELDRLRTRFVADVSHELRTPLAHIALFSETLALGRERSAEERQHFASTIHRETRRLTMLVESVLRFSRPDTAGRARSTAGPQFCDVSAEARDAVNAFGPLATTEQVNINLIVDAAPSDGIRALADAGAVRQIIFNLLDNAVKYGPRGQSATVRVALSGDDVLLSVEDEGPGIPPADRKRAFEPFTRLERPGAPHVSGTGIGLAVVRELVLTFGGRVWIEVPHNPQSHGARVVCAFRKAPTRATRTAVFAVSPAGE